MSVGRIACCPAPCSPIELRCNVSALHTLSHMCSAPTTANFRHRVRSCCILAADGRFQCAYPKCPKLYASQDAVRKHCRLQHLEWLRNLQTTTSKSHQQGAPRSSESPRLQALRCLPPGEALDLLQPDDWLSDLMDFDPTELSALPPPMAPLALVKDPSFSEEQHLEEQAVQACIRQLSTVIRRCPSTAQTAHMIKIVRMLSMSSSQISQLQPRERRTVLDIRRRDPSLGCNHGYSPYHHFQCIPLTAPGAAPPRTSGSPCGGSRPTCLLAGHPY